MRLRLRPLRATDEADALRGHEELAIDGFPFLLAWDPRAGWARYVERLDRVRQGMELPEGWVRSSFLAADVDGELVGRIDPVRAQ
jgi:predicted acetyltransferase